MNDNNPLCLCYKYKHMLRSKVSLIKLNNDSNSWRL